jgi:hypothetical protein
MNIMKDTDMGMDYGLELGVVVGGGDNCKIRPPAKIWIA